MRNKILGILKEIEPDSAFENSVDFFEDELIDSFGIITLINVLEETYSISIEADDISAENFMNLDCIEQLLNKYM